MQWLDLASCRRVSCDWRNVEESNKRMPTRRWRTFPARHIWTRPLQESQAKREIGPPSFRVVIGPACKSCSWAGGTRTSGYGFWSGSGTFPASSLRNPSARCELGWRRVPNRKFLSSSCVQPAVEARDCRLISKSMALGNLARVVNLKPGLCTPVTEPLGALSLTSSPNDLQLL